MKYYLIEIADGDTKIKGKGIYEYNNKRDAVASFHKKLGSAMSSELYTSELLMVIREDGTPMMRECWIAPVNVDPEEPPTIVEVVGE